MAVRRRKITLKLTPHPEGGWCKRIDGELEYFGGKGSSEAEARRELLDYIRAREFGLQAAARPTSERELHELADAYRGYYAARIRDGHVEQRTWDDYNTAITDFLAIVGPRLRVCELTPAVFSAVAGKWRDLAPSRRGNFIQTIRSMLLWAKVAVEYGPDFRKPAKSARRHERAMLPRRRFTQDDLACMWRWASPVQRRYLLLGLNCGMYAEDISELRWRDIQQVNGTPCLRWKRPKTEIPWICPLWPETVAVLPKRKRPDDLVFATRTGQKLVRMEGKSRIDEVARAIHRLLSRLGIKRPGVAFGAVRHTHTTATQGMGDVDAAKLARGHVLDGMAELYDHVDEPEEFSRLIAVADRARARLYVEPSGREIPPEVLKQMNARKPGRPRGRRAAAAG